MPIFKCPQKSEPLWKEWDQKAQKNGLRHQVFAVNGDHYVGEWKDNMKHGKGTQVWKKNGAIYEGDWKSGKRDGYGTLSLPDQETGKYKRIYSGWWKGDKKCGYGIQFFGPKEYYEGDWCGNQRSGWGRMYYSNGDIYEGQWHNDKPEGEGMLRLKNGNRYEGNWQRGVKNGSGRFFHLDHGQLFEGFWVDDVAKCGTMIDFGRDEAPQPTQFPIPEVGSSLKDPGTTPNLQTGNSSPLPATPNLTEPSPVRKRTVLFSVRASPGRPAVPPQSSQHPQGWQHPHRAGSVPKADSLGLLHTPQTNPCYFHPGQNSRSRRCVGGSLGHVQEDKRRRLMPERTPALQEEFKLESPNCSDRCGSCWRSKWGHTLGTLRRHLTPPSTGSSLPRRRNETEPASGSTHHLDPALKRDLASHPNIGAPNLGILWEM